MILRQRASKFEVHGLKTGRWSIHSILDDEALAVEEAQRMLADRVAQAVRVIAVRTSALGLTRESVVLEREAPPEAKPILLRPIPYGTPLCASAHDLGASGGRRAIGHIFHQYLARQQIGPTELLFHAGHGRKLSEYGGLLRSALSKLAQVQAPVTGEGVRERLQRLDTLVEEVEGRARRYLALSRAWRVPPPGDSAAIAAWAQGQARGQPGLFEEFFLTATALRLASVRTQAGKLEILAEDIATAPRQTYPLLDGLIADYLPFPEVIQDVFGPQRSLADFLIALTLLLRQPGTPALDTPRGPSLAALAAGLAMDALPETRAVLMEWLVRELASDHPLYRHDPDQEGAQLERVRQTLVGRDSAVFGGAPVEHALELRQAAWRQRAARGKGRAMMTGSLS